MFVNSLKYLKDIFRVRNQRKILAFGLSYVLFHHTNTICNLDNTQPAEIRILSTKELYGQLAAPQYYQNTLFLFNTKYNDILLPRLQGVRQIKVVQVQKNDTDEDTLTQLYDGVSINSKGVSRLFKLHHMHDIIKLQNFYDGVLEITDIEQVYQLLKDSDHRVIMSYIPEEKKNQSFQKTQETDFDLFKANNTKNLDEIETQFNQLKYENIDTFASHLVVKREDIARQLGLSSADIGQIYIMKKTTMFQNESSHLFRGQEYNMSRIEPDFNLENISHFQELEENQPNYIAQRLADYLYFNKHPDRSQINTKLETPKLDLMNVVPRISLRSLPYVSNIVNDAQLYNIALVGKQMGATYFLLCGLDGQKDNSKLLKKLIQLKRSLNTHQQQQIIIIASENQDLLLRYFQMRCDEVSDNIRLLKLNTRDVEQQIKFDSISQIKLDQTNLIDTSNNTLKDHIEEIVALSESAVRYRYFGKVTFNKLKFFLAQKIPQMNIQNVKEYEGKFLFHQHQEMQVLEEVPSYVETVTSIDVEKLVLNNNQHRSLMYFYKPNCNSCLAMSQSYDKLADTLQEIINSSEKIVLKQLTLNPYDNHILNRYRIKNPAKFAYLKIYKYNILNEKPRFPSPAASPLLYLFGMPTPVNLDLVKHRIGPADINKLIPHVIRVIDNS